MIIRIYKKCVVAIEKGSFRSPSTTVAKFTFYIYEGVRVCVFTQPLQVGVNF